MSAAPTRAAGPGWRRRLVLGLLGALAGAAGAQPAGRPISGFEGMGPELQAMQRDDARNPAMLWVRDAQDLWRQPAGRAAKACADCHGAVETAMRGVAARYPVFDAGAGRPLTLGARIDQCRVERQQAPPLAHEDARRLGLEALVALQSRGLPLQPSDDRRLDAWAERGRTLYRSRVGQVNLSCAQCHDERAGLRLGGNRIVQGHANGYPSYRLEWQALGSLARRVRNCMSGVRAEPWALGSDELLALEVHLARRSAGLALETPSVRP